MKNLLEELYPIYATLLGEGYDTRLEILKKQLPLEVFEVQSGTELGTWTVPDEWIVREAWIKYNGKKILDFSKNAHSLVLYSTPIHQTMDRDELFKNLYSKEDKADATPHVFKFYDKTWGFCIPKDKKEKLKEGEYEVFIDSEFKPGTLKIGVHTIPGETDEEVLLFAHLDHPFQANDNLSGVVALVELAKKIKSKYTIKIVFCPETIGSMAYIYTQDLSKVRFGIAIDICGNDESILLLKAFEPEVWINRISHCAFQIAAKPYRKAPFRSTIGSDETPFNDPLVGIPSICLTTHSTNWLEYHTDQDTPEKISYEKIEEVVQIITSIIEIAEKDYIPVRNFKGPLMRSKYGMQSPVPQINLNYDYLFYLMDGKKTLAELCAEQELNFTTIYDYLEPIIADGKIIHCPVTRETALKSTSQ